MNKLKNLLTNGRSILIVVVVISLIGFFLYQELKPKNHFLTISTTPSIATIYIDGQYAGVGSVQSRLIEKKYKLTISADGYETIETEVVLNKATSLSFELEQLPGTEPLENFDEFQLIKDQLVSQEDGTFVGLNRYDGLLYLYTTDNDPIQLHNNPVYDFDFRFPTIALIERDNQESVVLINIQNLTQNRRYLADYAPIVDVSFVPDSSDLYLLASLDATERTTTLYRTNPAFENLVEISKGKATKIEAIDQNKLIIFEEADAADTSIFRLVDVSSGSQLFETTTNSYVLSENKQFVLMKNTQGIKLLNTNSAVVVERNINLTSYLIGFGSDNQPLLVANNFPGVDIVYLDNITLENTQSVSPPETFNATVRWVVGSKNDLLYLIDTAGKIWQVRLTKN